MLKITLLIILLLVSGSTTTAKPVLGDAVTITPGWSRLKQSANQALRDPHVWARVEAGMHYPADVLAGWAVEHFVAYLAQDFNEYCQQQANFQ